MNTKKFKTILFLCAIGVTGCNTIGNSSYMDGGGDRKKEKLSKFGSFGPSTSGSSAMVRKIGSTNIVDNAILFAENSRRVAEEQLKHSKEELNKAKDMKDATSSNVRSSEHSNSNIRDLNTARKLIGIAKDADKAAEKSLRAAEEQVKRDEETLKNAEYTLELAKRDKQKT